MADETPPVNTSPHGPRNVRRIIRRCAIAGAIVACLWLLRGPILRMAAWPLVACEPAAGAKYLWIPSSPLGACCSPRYFDLVRDLYAEDRSRSVLIVRPVPERIVRMAAEPAFEQMVRDELARRGIPREAVIILPGPARNLWEEYRCVAAWMGEQGGQHHSRPLCRRTARVMWRCFVIVSPAGIYGWCSGVQPGRTSWPACALFPSPILATTRTPGGKIVTASRTL